MEMTAAGTMQIQIRTTTQTEILFIRETQQNQRCRKRQHRISGHKEQLKRKTVRFRKAPSACTDARLGMNLERTSISRTSSRQKIKNDCRICSRFFVQEDGRKTLRERMCSCRARAVLDKKWKRGSAEAANLSVCCKGCLTKKIPLFTMIQDEEKRMRGYDIFR